MRFNDKIYLQRITTEKNENLDTIEVVSWSDPWKCNVLPNTKSQTVHGNDGVDYVYAFEIMLRKPQDLYPKEGDMVRIVKKDGSVDATKRVLGHVILKGFLLKLWV